ncbi:MAG: hypothetical protein U0183_25460 [Polyangiaceae bacterium]
MPIRALGLYHHRIRELWPEVYELSDLEILSLYDTNIPRGLPPEIGRLEKLRAIDLGYNSSSARWDPALFRIPTLEVVLGPSADEPPPDLFARPARPLRILDMGSWRQPGPKAARELRLEAAIYPDWLLTSDDIARMPLRFLWTSKLTLPEGNPLETLGFDGDELPRWVAGLPALRHLHLSVKRLPDWLPELSGLETLVVRTYKADADALRPLERMRSLRRLGLFAVDTEELPLDLSGLELLELLAIRGPLRWADMPRGIPGLPALRRFFSSMPTSDEDAKVEAPSPPPSSTETWSVSGIPSTSTVPCPRPARPSGSSRKSETSTGSTTSDSPTGNGLDFTFGRVTWPTGDRVTERRARSS